VSNAINSWLTRPCSEIMTIFFTVNLSTLVFSVSCLVPARDSLLFCVNAIQYQPLEVLHPLRGNDRARHNPPGHIVVVPCDSSLYCLQRVEYFG